MRIKIFVVTAAALVAASSLAGAQGVVGGAEQGARDGARAAGPVGGVVGAVGGGIAGLPGIDQRPRFREYTIRERHDSYAYDRPVVVGAILPERGATYYEIPAEYGARDYRYTIVNGRAVLVDPKTHRIVDVID